MPTEFSPTAWSPRLDVNCKTQQPQTLGSPVEGAVGADLRLETLFLIKTDTGPLVCRFSSAPDVQQRGGEGGAAAGENYEGDDETSIAEPATSCRRRSGRNSQTKQVASTHTIEPDNDTKFIVLINRYNKHTHRCHSAGFCVCVCCSCRRRTSH